MAIRRGIAYAGTAAASCDRSGCGAPKRLIVKTGQGAVRTTCSQTLPMSSRLSPVRVPLHDRVQDVEVGLEPVRQGGGLGEGLLGAGGEVGREQNGAYRQHGGSHRGYGSGSAGPL